MFPTPFLNPAEAALIKQDFQDYLNSAEASNITIYYHEAINPELNEVYDVVEADEFEEKSLQCKAAQRIVSPYNTEILRFGILETGDSIFYISEDTNLYNMEYESIRIRVDDTPVDWIPVSLKYKDLYHHLGFRLGNTQVGQVLPCKLKLSSNE